MIAKAVVIVAAAQSASDVPHFPPALTTPTLTMTGAIAIEGAPIQPPRFPAVLQTQTIQMTGSEGS
jgi:hypothetical protein